MTLLRSSTRKLHTSLFVLSLFSLVFVSLRCSGTSGDDTTVQPVVQFAVSATVPVNGTTGPFDLYVPDPDSHKPHFTVQFTKIMDPSMITPSMVKVTGFDRAVAVLADAGMSHGNVIAFRVVRQGISGPTNLSVMFGINTHYTVTLDSTLPDPTGTQLGHPYTFSFTPEPAFRVLRYSFLDGETNVPANMQVFTNSQLGVNTLPSISIAPALASHWTINSANDSTSLLLDTYAYLNPGTNYTVTVAANAKDRNGNALTTARQAVLHTPAMTIATSQFPMGKDSVNLSMPITFTSNYPLDIASASTAFSLSPATPFALNAGEKEVTFSAANDYTPNTNYTAKLSTALRTISGYAISAPIVLNFHTSPFGFVPVPSEGTTGFSRHDVITLNFSGALNVSTVDSTTILLNPDFAHYIRFSQDYPGKQNIVYIVPKAPLPPVTRYTVTVSNVIQSAAGYQMAQVDSFHFTTSF